MESVFFYDLDLLKTKTEIPLVIQGKGAYIGELINGEMYGKGYLKYMDGHTSYIGDFVFGKKEGKGKIFYDGNLIFEGNFLNGKPFGRCTSYEYYSNNCLKKMICGKIVNDKVEGYGLEKRFYLTIPPTKYLGYFKHGKYEGLGMLYKKINHDWKLYYSGKFVDGCINGYGQINGVRGYYIQNNDICDPFYFENINTYLDYIKEQCKIR